MEKLIAILLIGLCVITGCSNSKETSLARIEKISVDEVYKISENIDKYQEYVIIDVRTEDEYNGGHIKNAINIPVANISEIEVSKDKKIIVYCRSGSRSTTAAGELQKLGYKSIYNMGGVLDWNYDLVKEGK